MPALRTRKFKPDELVVCIESFASSDPELGGCARGTRLRGNNPVVRKWPAYFMPADSSGDELNRARAKFYEDSGAPPPPAS
jgi:hypothetical protein